VLHDEYPSNKKNLLIFIDTHIGFDPFHQESYMCTRDIFALKFMNRYNYDLNVNESMVARGMGSLKREIVLAWHFRYGDEASGSLHLAPTNALKYELGVAVMNKLLYHDAIVLRRLHTKHLRAKFVVWGPPDGSTAVFDEVKHLFNGRIEVLIGQTVEDDYNHFEILATADVIVGGLSSFTRFAAAANMFGVTIVDGHTNNPRDRYGGFNNTLPIDFRVEDFNTLFCRQLLNGGKHFLHKRMCTSKTRFRK